MDVISLLLKTYAFEDGAMVGQMNVKEGIIIRPDGSVEDICSSVLQVDASLRARYHMTNALIGSRKHGTQSALGVCRNAQDQVGAKVASAMDNFLGTTYNPAVPPPPLVPTDYCDFLCGEQKNNAVIAPPQRHQQHHYGSNYSHNENRENHPHHGTNDGRCHLANRPRPSPLDLFLPSPPMFSSGGRGHGGNTSQNYRNQPGRQYGQPSPCRLQSPAAAPVVSTRFPYPPLMPLNAVPGLVGGSGSGPGWAPSYGPYAGSRPATPSPLPDCSTAHHPYQRRRRSNGRNGGILKPRN